MLINKMLLCLLLFGVALSAPSDDMQSLIDEAGIDSIGEITMDDETFLMHIVPSGIMSKKFQKMPKAQLSDIVNTDNGHYKTFMDHMEKGYTMKGLTFNIYDKNIRKPTMALFRILCEIVDSDNLKKIKEWAKHNINDHMFDYAERLSTLFRPQSSAFESQSHKPPFLVKPNFFVNGETIIKALRLKGNLGMINYQDATVNQYYKTDNLVTINTNYSGWNSFQKGCEDKIDYFTEDISLNSYYYGVHLLHPFWMSNNELDEINPRQAEHYYFTHQQLWARYNLEKLSLKQRSIFKNCDDEFIPNLIYNNGLSFPTRSNALGDWSEDRAKLKAIDIGIKEFISRGFFIMDNGTIHVNLSADNYISLIAKIIRANFDNANTANIVRSLGGFGRNDYDKNGYNPAPSLMHQPETSLRDPAYWYMIELMLNYFNDFQLTLEPFDLSDYESNDIAIINSNFTKLTTFFDYYQFAIDQTQETSCNNDYSTLTFAARQRRLSHLPIEFDFTIMSKHEKHAVVRLFLGPQCSAGNCWQHHRDFFQIDAWNVFLQSGENFIKWSPTMSKKFSSDAAFNEEEGLSQANIEAYNMFYFPENLFLPKGLENGLNLTLFIIVTPQPHDVSQVTEVDLVYNTIYSETDEKPLGFPFHRLATNYQDNANNYKFYNVTIFHKKRTLDGSGYFSPHLY